MSTHQVTPQSLVEQGLHASVSDDCMVVVRDSTGANLRWANNTLTTNGVMHGMDVSVVSFVRGTGGVQVGTVSGRAASQAQVPARVRAADAAATGRPDPLHTSLAKCTANEMAKKVTDLAMQIHGGNGYTEEYGIERLHRDAHGWAIAGGTPTMQRIRIVSEVLGRKFDQRR